RSDLNGKPAERKAGLSTSRGRPQLRRLNEEALVPDDYTRDSAISFGPFRLFPKARFLQRDGSAIRIGSRALEILIILTEQPGEIINKRELIKRVWLDVNVDESSLRFQVAALRKAIGDGTEGVRYVVNVPGRGYYFAAPIAQRGTPSID